ncbi:hypothetical protein CERZMDRAFT_107598 [Cercospora zeae-maydis SCOH1-5]|uniref:Uncharacterized protein n=1 Tax=Cercospora zeae-maydis SCOH1-5 TaxID=717836 RepID=A0A6A6F6B8_9PEZI|nr:hypothetical protein CERZMDRAFT_107598 [Cercospora zeae-maydis SCOH1-5]
MSRPHQNSSKDSVTPRGGILATPRTESIQSQRRRNEAAEVLQSYEQLSWYAYQRCETLAQTRIHFRCIVAGINPEQEDLNVYWREDFTPRASETLRQSTSARRGKEKIDSERGADSKETPLDVSHSTSTIAKDKTIARPSSSATRNRIAEREL